MRLQELVVVDEDNTDRIATLNVLEAAAVADFVRAFASCQDALDYLQRPEGHEVDVVLLGIGASAADGLAFLQPYEQLHPSQRARAVVLMLRAATAPHAEAKAPGFGSVLQRLTKPLDATQVQALASMLA